MMVGDHIVTKKKLSTLTLAGANNNSVLDIVVAVLFAFCPILQHYRGIYVSLGFCVLALIALYLLLKLSIRCLEKKNNNVAKQYCIVMVLLFQLYRMFDHGISVDKLCYFIMVMIIVIAVMCECLNLNIFLKSTIFVACTAAVFLVLQYIFYYVFNYHLRLVPISLLVETAEQWKLLAQTGLIGVRGELSKIYRPSAFFLEPSHLYVYSFPVLCFLLLLPNINVWRKKRALLVTIGMCLSTSGMGIACSIGVWLIYLMFSHKGSLLNGWAMIRRLFSLRNIFVVLILTFMLFVAYSHISIFAGSVNRVIMPSTKKISGGTGFGAIDGRTRRAISLVSTISGKQMLLGVSEDVSDVSFHLPGFFWAFYKYGILGVILSYLFYLYSFLHLKNAYFYISGIIIVTSFFCVHTHGTFYMLYYIVLLVSGYDSSKIVRR